MKRFFNKKWLICILAFFSVGVSAACALSSYWRPSCAWVSHQPLAGWVHYNSLEGGFSVSLPQDPNIEHGQITVPESKGPITYLQLKSYQGKQICYAVGYLPMPEKWGWVSQKTVLKKVLDVVVSEDAQAQLISQTLVNEGGRTVLEYHLHAHGEDVLGRLFIVDGKLFRMTATTTTPCAHAKVESEAFFNSFAT